MFSFKILIFNLITITITVIQGNTGTELVAEQPYHPKSKTITYNLKL